MKLTFLGTAAAEQYPGIWCDCEYCARARKLGGKNIRRTSSVYFAEDCMIDFPPEVFSQAGSCDIDLRSLKLLLLTHSHEDHFYPTLFTWRYRPKEAEKLSVQQRFEKAYCRQEDLPTLHIFGNECGYTALMNSLVQSGDLSEYSLDYTIVEPYREYSCNDVKFIPMVASHTDRSGQKGLIYIVELKGRTFLYASDSGPYTEETRACIAKYKYDVIIMEQTCGYANDHVGQHMSWQAAMAEKNFFEEADVWKNEPRIYWTHMSPHRTPPQTDLEKLLADTPITPAYDGLEIEF